MPPVIAVTEAAPHAANEGRPERLQRIMREARTSARAHVGELEDALQRVAVLAQEVSTGGAVYPAGLRGLCDRVREQILVQHRSVEGLRRLSLPA